MKKVLLVSLLVCGIATANAASPQPTNEEALAVTNDVTGVLDQEIGDLTSLTKEEKTSLMAWVKDHKVLVTVATLIVLGGTASGLCYGFGDKLQVADNTEKAKTFLGKAKKFLASTANLIAKPASLTVDGSKKAWHFTTDGKKKYISGGAAVLVAAVLTVIHDLAIRKDPKITKIWKKIVNTKKAKEARPVIA